MKYIFTFLIFFLFIGCNQTPQVTKKVATSQNYINTIEQELSFSLENASELSQKHSKWFQRKEKLPLKIIGVGFIDPKVKKTKEYYYFIKLLRSLEKKPYYLGQDLAKHYSSLKFINFSRSNHYKEKFSTAYNNKNASKDVLIDILRPEKNTPLQELFIALDYNALKHGDLTLHGYKYVKQTNKQANAYYYTLTKKGYKKLSKKAQRKAIIQSIQTLLSLSIPEYISVDRKKILGDTKRFEISILYPDGNVKASIYLYTPKQEIKATNDKIDQTLVNNITAKNYLPFVSTALAISTDGNNILIGKSNGEIKFLDLKTGNFFTLKGHKDKIVSLALSEDNRYAVSASWDDTIRIWDLKKKRSLKKVPYKDHIVLLEFLKNKRNILILHSTSLKKNRIDFLNIQTGKIEKTYKNTGFRISKAALSFDNKFLLVGTYDGDLKLWNLQNGKIKKTLPGEKQRVTAVALSKDRRYALSIDLSKPRKIKYWDLRSAQVIKTLPGLKAQTNNVSFVFNDQYAICGSNDKIIRIWNLQTGKLIKKFMDHDSSEIYRLKVSQNSAAMISGNNDSVMYWKLLSKRSKAELQKLKQQIKAIQELAVFRENFSKQKILTTPFSLSDRQILQNYNYISSTNINTITINEISKALNYTLFDPVLLKYLKTYKKITSIPIDDELTLGEKYQVSKLYFASYIPLQKSNFVEIVDFLVKSPYKTLDETNDERIRDIAFLPNNRYVIYGTYKKKAQLLDLKTNKIVHTFKGRTKITGIAVYNNGRYALVASSNIIQIIDLKNAKAVGILKGHSDLITNISVDKYGRYAVSGGFDKNICYWDLKRKKLLKKIYIGGWIEDVAISADGKYAFCGDYQKDLYYINLKTSKIIGLKAHSSSVYAVAISHDGRYGLSGDKKGTIYYWDLRSGKVIKELDGHSNTIYSLHFSKDEKHCLSTSKDTKILYWDLKKGKFIQYFEGSTAPVKDAVISHDGKFIISGGDDRKLRLWKLK